MEIRFGKSKWLCFIINIINADYNILIIRNFLKNIYYLRTMKNSLILFSFAFLVFNSACSHKPTPVIRIPIAKRSVAIIYNGSVQVFKDDPNNPESIPGVGSGVTKIAVDASFEKMAYQKAGSNIKIVNIANGSLLEEIQNSQNAKDFHFQKLYNELYYLSNTDKIIYTKSNMPFANVDLNNLSGGSTAIFTNAIIGNNNILMIESNLSRITYTLHNGSNVIDRLSSFEYNNYNFVVVKQINEFNTFDVLFHDLSSPYTVLENYFGISSINYKTSFKATVANDYTIDINDNSSSFTIINNSGVKSFNGFDDNLFTGIAF
jgi:hypothetical protein